MLQLNTTANPIYISGLAPDGGLNVYSQATRPAANAVGAIAGISVIMIWNSTDKAPNFSDGTNWYDAEGNIT
jgi:hypothetical protein